MLIVLFWSPLKRQVVSCFFFSSRRRHTRLTCDWSSDVLFRSLDGARHRNERRLLERLQPRGQSRGDRGLREIGRASCRKECRSRWSPYHSKKKMLAQMRDRGPAGVKNAVEVDAERVVSVLLAYLGFFFQAEDGIRD